MPGNDQQQKTEQPTPRRISEARKKGQVAKSTELQGALLLLVVALFFYCTREHFIWTLERFMRMFLRSFTSYVPTPDNIPHLVLTGGYFLVQVLGPVFVVAVMVALVTGLAQVGFLFAPEVLKPQASRINPAEGFKRIFSTRGLMELAKSLLKISAVGALLFFLIKTRIQELLVLAEATPGAATWLMARFLIIVIGAAGAAYLVIALLDFIYQRHSYHKQMMMSKTELKEELRQTEGDPQVKSWLRRRQREVALNRIKDEVPKATVVVTNPVHLAVALRYEEGDEAPKVVAKGAGDLAKQIRKLAREHNIPLVENPPVARMLFRLVNVGDTIPTSLYQAVAEILAMVYRLSAERNRKKAAM
ncbi:MAG: flagellar biosynthesis protein FlhB [Peptococcaceae bacterium]|nr:flagellar biosynthesis protein FlhB [Peptococcaceae bacterium]